MIETAYVFRPNAGPGEASLAQGGVLFLDGLQDFPHATLTALRPALETGRAAVVRAGASIAYRACFQLLAAMEPCRPGKDRPGRVGSAFLGRIDLVVHVPQIEPTERARAPAGEASAEVVARVRQARACRRARSDEGHTAMDARTAVEAGEPLSFLSNSTTFPLTPRLT